MADSPTRKDCVVDLASWRDERALDEMVAPARDAGVIINRETSEGTDATPGEPQIPSLSDE